RRFPHRSRRPTARSDRSLARCVSRQCGPGDRVDTRRASGRERRHEDRPWRPAAPAVVAYRLWRRGSRGCGIGAMRRIAAWAAILATSLGSPSPAFAYLKLGATVNGQIVDVSWRQQPIRYFVADRDGPGVTAAELRGAIGRATATGQGVASATVRFEFAGSTSAIPGDADGRTTLGFLDRPDLDRVL